MLESIDRLNSAQDRKRGSPHYNHHYSVHYNQYESHWAVNYLVDVQIINGDTYRCGPSDWRVRSNMLLKVIGLVKFVQLVRARRRGDTSTNSGRIRLFRTIRQEEHHAPSDHALSDLRLADFLIDHAPCQEAHNGIVLQLTAVMEDFEEPHARVRQAVQNAVKQIIWWHGFENLLRQSIWPLRWNRPLRFSGMMI